MKRTINKMSKFYRQYLVSYYMYERWGDDEDFTKKNQYLNQFLKQLLKCMNNSTVLVKIIEYLEPGEKYTDRHFAIYFHSKVKTEIFDLDKIELLYNAHNYNNNILRAVEDGKIEKIILGSSTRKTRWIQDDDLIWVSVSHFILR